jgi:hypothetical protein
MKCLGSASHGTAVWVTRFFRNQHSLRSESLCHGVIPGEQMLAGIDVDELVKQMWVDTGAELLDIITYMETSLMLASSKVIVIQSTRVDGVVSCSGLIFDEKFYPSGLTGRFLDELVKREGNHGKEESKGCRAGVGSGGRRRAIGCPR